MPTSTLHITVGQNVEVMSQMWVAPLLAECGDCSVDMVAGTGQVITAQKVRYINGQWHKFDKIIKIINRHSGPFIDELL